MAQERHTVQKEQIYTALLKLANHPTADDVYDSVRSEHPKISRATVYRVLNQMADSGKILRIDIPGAASRFDHRYALHSHVRCVECGNIRDIEGDADFGIDISSLYAEDFKILGYNLVFNGLCRQCGGERL